MGIAPAVSRRRVSRQRRNPAPGNYGGIMRKALIAALAVSFIAGCSSISTAQAPVDNTDYLYVTVVENAAKQYGTYVVWINVPQKREASVQ